MKKAPHGKIFITAGEHSVACGKTERLRVVARNDRPAIAW